MNTKEIWLVTTDRVTGYMEPSTLDQWIRKDQDLWARRNGEMPVLSYLILSAHDSCEEAEARIEELKST
jgi:hypothetical protein